MSAPTRRLSIEFGALADPLKKQLAEQGLTMAKPSLNRLQMVMDSRTDLTIGSYLSEAEAVKVSRRIMKAIAREVRKAKAVSK